MPFLSIFHALIHCSLPTLRSAQATSDRFELLLSDFQPAEIWQADQKILNQTWIKKSQGVIFLTGFSSAFFTCFPCFTFFQNAFFTFFKCIFQMLFHIFHMFHIFSENECEIKGPDNPT